MQTFIKRSRLPFPAETVFDWHTRPGALQRLTPPWEHVEIVSRSHGIADGARAELRVKIGPLRHRWIAKHRGLVEGRLFQDVQIEGPFRRWEHTHRFIPDGADACILEDRIEYALPFGRLGRLLGARIARGALARAFAYRHQITAADLAAHERFRGSPPMKVLISGASGLVGSQLVPLLQTGGHETFSLTRGEASGEDCTIHWDPAKRELNAERLRGFDAVVHLAGESIAARWTTEKKRRIRDSRIDGTYLLCSKLAELDDPPQVLVTASAVGYYGDRGDEVLTEVSPPDDGFLPDVCKGWESACEPAREKGIRVVNLRIGVVLSSEGGALAKMLMPFKLGVGGIVGSGRQYLSWIALDDLIGAIHHALMTNSLSGPANATAPQPVTNREFTKTLGKVLHRPTVFPMPAFGVRLAFGEMGDALLLSSARVLPQRLTQSGYEFRFPVLEPALRHVLGRGE